MQRFLVVALLGVAAVGLMLAAPSVSQAQVGCGPSGYGSYYGGTTYPAYAGYGAYANRGYAPGYGGGYAPSYDGYCGRPVIEHPTSGHWTPGRGYHEHGHIHVPHRRHDHTYRY